MYNLDFGLNGLDYRPVYLNSECDHDFGLVGLDQGAADLDLGLFDLDLRPAVLDLQCGHYLEHLVLKGFVDHDQGAVGLERTC